MPAKRVNIIRVILASMFVLGITMPAYAAWPTQSQWIPAISNTWEYITDPRSDVSPGGHLDLVTDLTTASQASTYWYFDGTDIYFRMILDGDPVKDRGTVKAELLPFGWNVLVESTGDNFPDWSITADGTGSADSIHTMYNLGLDSTMDGETGYKVTATQTPYIDADGFQILVNGYVRSKQTTTDSTKWHGGNPDFYLDFEVPLLWLSRMGYSTPAPVTGSTPIKFAFGTGASGQTINKDLAGQTNTTVIETFFATVPSVGLDSGGSYGAMRDTRHTSSPPDMGIWFRGEQVTVSGFGWPGGGIYYSGFLTVRITDPSDNIAWQADIPVNSNGNVISAPTLMLGHAAALGVYKIFVADPRDTSIFLYKDTFTVASSEFGTSTKQVDKATAGINEVLTYTITIINSGNLAGLNVVVTDQLPGDVTYMPGTTTLNGNQLSDSGSSSALIAGVSLGAVQPGGTHTFVLKAKVNPASADGTVITNTAIISWTGGSISRSTTTTVIAPRIAITKEVDLERAMPGQILTYTAYVMNSGSMTATSIEVLDAIPWDTEYVTGSATRGGGIDVLFRHDATGPYDTDETLPITSIKWTIPELGAGQGMTLTFLVRIK